MLVSSAWMSNLSCGEMYGMIWIMKLENKMKIEIDPES